VSQKQEEKEGEEEAVVSQAQVLLQLLPHCVTAASRILASLRHCRLQDPCLITESIGLLFTWDAIAKYS
jgi:hypothetical protein